MQNVHFQSETGIKLRSFSLDQPTWIVAEVSANHNQSIESAILLIDAAANAGANAVKFQTYTADTISMKSDAPDFVLPSDSPWKKYRNYYSLYEEASTPWEWHRELFNHARQRNLVPFSSPFDETAVELLEKLNCPVYKVASPEIRHIPLIQKIAKTGKPIIFSLGTSTSEDFELALESFRSISNSEIGVLQCDTEYPAKFERANLNLLSHLSERYNVIAGYSDHTLGNIASIAAVCKGAKIIEKHISLSGVSSVDDFFSLEEKDFSNLVKEIRIAESTFGSSDFRKFEEVIGGNRSHRSIYPVRNIAKGKTVTVDDIRVIRPGFGLHPKFFTEIIGRSTSRDLIAGERISLDDFI